jgi:hypothetical protein
MTVKSFPNTESLVSLAQAKIAFSIGVLLALCGVAAPPAEAASPTPFLQDSTIVGSGGTLTATGVPVETSTGSIVYQDVTIQLNANAKGGLALAPGYPKVEAPPSIITSGFLAGHYAGPPTVASGQFLITVTGPAVGANGTTVWSLTPSKGANSCTTPLTATWYTGPLAENPLAPRLKKAGITSTDYSYGIVGATEPISCGPSFTEYYDPFSQNCLIGVSQAQGSLIIVSFTPATGAPDSSTPIAQITYTLLSQ